MQLQRTTVFPTPAPNAFRSEARCDSDGHAFVQLALLAGYPLRLEPLPSVSELIPDEKRIVAYGTAPLPESDYPHATVTSFSVLPDGRLYALVFTRRLTSKGKPLSEPQYYVERFKDDGTRDSITLLHTPPGVVHWYADQMAPFSDGSFLIAGTGTAAKERPGAGSWRPLTAIYGSSGRLIREVTLPQDISNNFNEGGAGKPGAAGRANAQASPIPASKPRQYFDAAITQGSLLSGPYGNVWIFRNSDPIRVYAVDSAGQVTQHFEFSPPAAGLAPFDFGFAGPQDIFFDFARPAGGRSAPSEPSELIGVFNTTSERFEALYRLPEEAKGIGVLACSDGNGGFLYLGGTRDGRLAVFDFAPR